MASFFPTASARVATELGASIFFAITSGLQFQSGVAGCFWPKTLKSYLACLVSVWLGNIGLGAVAQHLRKQVNVPMIQKVERTARGPLPSKDMGMD